MNKINGCIETMHYKNGKILLLYSHIKRLRKSMKHISGERLDEHQFKNDLWTYIQTIEDCEYVISLHYHTIDPQFIFSKRNTPIRVHTPQVGISQNSTLPIHSLSWIKKTDRTLYDQAIMEAKEKNWDDAILLNELGNVCESTIANIFLRKDNVYYTPDLSQGCVAGVYRDRFMTECKLKNIKVIEQAISVADLYEADEVFLCNAVRKLYPINLLPLSKEKNVSHEINELIQQQLNFD